MSKMNERSNYKNKYMEKKHIQSSFEISLNNESIKFIVWAIFEVCCCLTNSEIHIVKQLIPQFTIIYICTEE